MKSLKQQEQLQGYTQQTLSPDLPMKHLNAIWSRIGSVPREEVIRCILKDEIDLCKERIQPHDTGHLHTAISVMESRLEEIDPYAG